MKEAVEDTASKFKEVHNSLFKDAKEKLSTEELEKTKRQDYEEGCRRVS